MKKLIHQWKLLHYRQNLRRRDEAGYSDDDGTQWLRIQYDDEAWSILNGNEKLTLISWIIQDFL